MSDELLARMSRALADEYDGASAAPEAARARILRTLAARRRPRKRKWLLIGIPIFVLFGGSTAWAAVTKQLDRIVEQAIAVVAGEPQAPAEPPEPTQPATKRTASVARPPHPPKAEEEKALEGEESAEEDLETEAETEREATVVPPAKPQPIPKRRNFSSPPARSVAAGVKASGKETEGSEVEKEDHTALLTFRSAHRAQFSNGNCAQAISGYERYLRLAPQGPFALEASYNRGVCLIRLGQHAAGRSALEPFAQGAHGNYRRSQSEQILQAIGNEQGPR